MPIIVVEVMPKAELLDPQGKAVAGALARTGSRFTGVRIGKRFELEFDGEADDAALDDARELADSMLSNSVIEDVVSVHHDVPSGGSRQAHSPLAGGAATSPDGAGSTSAATSGPPASSTTVIRGEPAASAPPVDTSQQGAASSTSVARGEVADGVVRGEVADESLGDA